MGQLLVDDSGKLDINSVASLSLDEIREWVFNRLHGRDTVVPGDVRQGDLPHYLLAQIYQRLDRNSRDYILLCVREFLVNMSRNPASPWRGEAAHSLLLLAQRLGERELIPPIREMVESGIFFDADSNSTDDLHRRLLQSLVALEWRGTCEFWREQFSRLPERYAGVVFAGLAQVAPHHAFDILPAMPWESADVRAQVKVALRGLLPTQEHNIIGNLLTKISSRLEPDVRDMLSGFLPEVAPFIARVPVWRREEIIEVLAGRGQTDFGPKQLSSYATA